MMSGSGETAYVDGKYLGYSRMIIRRQGHLVKGGENCANKSFASGNARRGVAKDCQSETFRIDMSAESKRVSLLSTLASPVESAIHDLPASSDHDED